MRVVICSPEPTLAANVARAVTAIGIEADAEPDPQEFGSQLFRDPDALGLLWTAGASSAALMITDMRIGSIKNPIVVLMEQELGGQTPKGGRDRAAVLMAGADDAQPSDIEPVELVHRIRAVANRGIYIDHLRIDLPNGCVFDPESGAITGGAEPAHLTVTQGRILVHLARHAGEVRSKFDLMDALYAGENEPEVKIIDILICKTRHQIMQATGGLDVIETVWGRGYQFLPDGYRPELTPTRRRVRG